MIPPAPRRPGGDCTAADPDGDNGGVHVFAHQGGWDEMLLVATPIALLALILWLANRRANRQRDERAQAERARAEPRDP